MTGGDRPEDTTPTPAEGGELAVRRVGIADSLIAALVRVGLEAVQRTGAVLGLSQLPLEGDGAGAHAELAGDGGL